MNNDNAFRLHLIKFSKHGNYAVIWRVCKWNFNFYKGMRACFPEIVF